MYIHPIHSLIVIKRFFYMNKEANDWIAKFNSFHVIDPYYIKRIYELESPDWEVGGKVHNWKNYIPEEFRLIWSELSVDARSMAYYFAEKIASTEEWE